MSVATEFAPVVFIPQRARERNRPLAPVIELHRPSEQSIAAPLRLTRRGALVLAAVVGALAVGLVWLAASAAPSAAGSGAGSVAADAVTVRSGDTLWSIAARVAPHTDPRLEVATLQRLNQLDSAELTVGQLLRTR
ncbi:MAG: hypothetical protein QOE97_119 [Pseudonocardiales bacterium]|nr:hypothetical protein [Pseudonocardiales bacterium]